MKEHFELESWKKWTLPLTNGSKDKAEQMAGIAWNSKQQSSYSTEFFTNFEPQSPSNDVSVLHKAPLSLYYEALSLRNVRSGRSAHFINGPECTFQPFLKVRYVGNRSTADWPARWLCRSLLRLAFKVIWPFFIVQLFMLRYCSYLVSRYIS